MAVQYRGGVRGAGAPAKAGVFHREAQDSTNAPGHTARRNRSEITTGDGFVRPSAERRQAEHSIKVEANAHQAFAARATPAPTRRRH
jgi:hypothetical protein